MKRIISFAAAVIMAFSGIGHLAFDVSAATKTTRTGKQLTYEEAYNRLKDLEFAKGTTTDSKTTNKTTNKTTDKTTTKTTENKKNKHNGRCNYDGLQRQGSFRFNVCKT